jgi:hypothetical protein
MSITQIINKLINRIKKNKKKNKTEWYDIDTRWDFEIK